MNLSQLAKSVGKTAPAVIAIQRKYGLLRFHDYSDGYAVLLRKVMYLAVFSVPVKDIKALLVHERSLLELLKVDSIQDSPDWFESACTSTSGPRRLLLSGYNVGHALTGELVQTGLDFRDRAQELFNDLEMGADALHGVRRYVEALDRVRARLAQERNLVREAMAWCNQVAQ